jgi:CBS domain-containing protein
MTVTVRQMLRDKTFVYTVEPDSTVFEALELMAEHNIGAVLVVSDGRIQGIMSERDYARKGILQGKNSKDTLVTEIMTAPVICVEPTFTADRCMALMTERRIRHLPVMQDDQLLGIISIGDVVRAVVAQQRMLIDALESYIRTA